MGKVTGFLEIKRAKPSKRPVHERVEDWKEFEGLLPEEELRKQGARCMDCGIPFCHQGCPLGNQIPDWNDLVYRGGFREAIDALHATNNFPEFTGRVCPAPCEEACVLKLSDAPVTIKHVERQIIDRAFSEGWITAEKSTRATGKKVAVVGSGPAGLAAAQQLARAGHAVTVFEKSDRVGGLLRYGIPDFKLEKHLIDRRVAQMEAEGVRFVTGVDAGAGEWSGEKLKSDFDAVLLCVGALRARELEVPGRELRGVHLAMEYLEGCNRAVQGDGPAPIDAKGKRVVILGGGDTGADCLGSAHRQGAISVQQYELLERPPEGKNNATPWPWWPVVLRSSAAHEEGGDRAWCMLTQEVVGDEEGRVRALKGLKVEWREKLDGSRFMKETKGSEWEVEADLVLLAMGFTGPDTGALFEGLGVKKSARGTAEVGGDYQTSARGVFACGDARRGASLVVWAIREGRECARAVDAFLTGEESALPGTGRSAIDE